MGRPEVGLARNDTPWHLREFKVGGRMISPILHFKRESCGLSGTEWTSLAESVLVGQCIEVLAGGDLVMNRVVWGLARGPAANLFERDKLAVHVIFHLWLVALRERCGSLLLLWVTYSLVEEMFVGFLRVIN